MRGRGEHPEHAALLAWAGGHEDAAVSAHVAECASCQARATDWQGMLGEVRQQLRDEADGHFPEARLARQRAEISRRLRGASRARVLPFPAVAPVAQVGPGATKGAEPRRWVAAAALLGLVLGGASGRMLDRPWSHPMPEGAGEAATSTGAILRPASAPAESAAADDTFLVELDAALVTPGPGPLRALDAITPDQDLAHRPR